MCHKVKQNRESTEGYSKSIVRKITTSSEKGLVLTSTTYASPKVPGPGVRRSKRPLSASHTRCKCLDSSWCRLWLQICTVSGVRSFYQVTSFDSVFVLFSNDNNLIPPASFPHAFFIYIIIQTLQAKDIRRLMSAWYPVVGVKVAGHNFFCITHLCPWTQLRKTGVKCNCLQNQNYVHKDLIFIQCCLGLSLLIRLPSSWF